MKSKILILFLIFLTIGFSYFYFNISKKSAFESVKSTVEPEPAIEKTTDSTEISLNDSNKVKDEQALIEKKHEDIYKQGFDAFFNGDRAKAIALENQIIEEDPNFYKAYNLKGIALCYSQNFKDGMENIDKALELNPNFGYARFNKALAYELYERFDEALIWYDKNLEVENYKWSHYGKASIYGRRGDVTNAIKYLKIAVTMDPTIKADAKNEKDFNNVKSSKEFKDLVNN